MRTVAAALLVALCATPLGAQERKMEYRSSSHGRTLRVELHGEVEFSDDDRVVTRLSGGGRLVIEEELRGGTDRRIEFAWRRGGVDTVYEVNGRERPLDAEGRRWIGGLLPDVIRQTGFAADRRVARFYRGGGVSAVLAEIDRLRSDGARHRYYRALLRHDGLPPAAASAALRHAARSLESDGDMAALLHDAAGVVALEDDDARRAFFGAAASISSDGDLAAVLIRLLRRGPQPAVLRDVLIAARDIDSDGDKTAVLLSVDGARLRDEALGDLYMETAETIDSDGDRSAAMLHLLRSTVRRGATR